MHLSEAALAASAGRCFGRPGRAPSTDQLQPQLCPGAAAFDDVAGFAVCLIYSAAQHSGPWWQKLSCRFCWEVGEPKALCLSSCPVQQPASECTRRSLLHRLPAAHVCDPVAARVSQKQRLPCCRRPPRVPQQQQQRQQRPDTQRTGRLNSQGSAANSPRRSATARRSACRSTCHRAAAAAAAARG